MSFKEKPLTMAFHADTCRRIDEYIKQARYEIPPKHCDVVHHALELFLTSKGV